MEKLSGNIKNRKYRGILNKKEGSRSKEKIEKRSEKKYKQAIG